MPLQSGTRIGGYEILSLRGAGGMGEVYRARDTRLGRDVAIKILSPRIAADREAVLRFEREARALATLNHPNIAAIYDVIENGEQPALVLELVPGDTLADRIAARSISIEQAIDYGRQIADALDVAHEAGIVHRDLKPANIKLTEDGRIKVLDFGLAKAIAAAAGEVPGVDAANSPTITVHGTGQGVILGTAAYMSPEQARGKRIDKRTDIWAFGCVLFEMLTGKRAFDGETTSDVIAAIIERAPDLSLLPAATPAHVRRIIARCLEKDPKRRARDIADVRIEFDPTPVTATRPRRSLLVPALAAIAAIAGIASVVLWRSRPEPGVAPLTIELAITPPPGHVLEPVQGSPSPDGRYVAFVARDEKRGTRSSFGRSMRQHHGESRAPRARRPRRSGRPIAGRSPSLLAGCGSASASPAARRSALWRMFRLISAPVGALATCSCCLPPIVRRCSKCRSAAANCSPSPRSIPTMRIRIAGQWFFRMAGTTSLQSGATLPIVLASSSARSIRQRCARSSTWLRKASTRSQVGCSSKHPTRY